MRGERYMDVKIFGSGTISTGEYDNIRIAGSGRARGLLRCENFYSAGSVHGDGEILCKNSLETSGSAVFEKSIKTGKLHSGGSFSCRGDLMVEEELKGSGSVKCEGSVKCRMLCVDGNGAVEGDLEAERLCVIGGLQCRGLVNAEEIEIRVDCKKMTVGSIGGSVIKIYPHRKRTKLENLVCVKNSIEGDEITLEGVIVPRVSGRIVRVGRGCEVELLQYSEQAEISPDANVKKTEKLL